MKRRIDILRTCSWYNVDRLNCIWEVRHLPMKILLILCVYKYKEKGSSALSDFLRLPPLSKRNPQYMIANCSQASWFSVLWKATCISETKQVPVINHKSVPARGEKLDMRNRPSIGKGKLWAGKLLRTSKQPAHNFCQLYEQRVSPLLDSCTALVCGIFSPCHSSRRCPSPQMERVMKIQRRLMTQSRRGGKFNISPICEKQTAMFGFMLQADTWIYKSPQMVSYLHVFKKKHYLI